MGESNMMGEYVALPDKDVAKKEVYREITWKHLVTVGASLFLLSCPYIGPSVMIQLFATNGVGSHICAEGQNYCSQQVLMVSNIFTIAMFSVLIFSLPAGVLYDKLGGRLLSLCGNVLVVASWIALGFLLHFGNAGYDRITFPLFGLTMVISGFACVLKLTGAMCIAYFFHDYMGLVVACIVISSSLEQLQPLGIAFLVIGGHVSLATICFLHAVVSAVGTMLLYWALPSYEHYRSQAEKATGMKQSESSDGFFRIMKLGAKIIWANMSEHFVVMVSWVLGISWAASYMNVSVQYATFLLGNPGDPSDPVNKMVTAKMSVITIGCSIVVAVGIFPFAAALDETSNGKFIPVSMAVATGLSAMLMTVPSWTAQIAVTATGAYTGVAVSLCLNNRALAFSPPNRLGTVRGLLECAMATLAMPISIGTQVALGALPDPAHMWARVFSMSCTTGFFALTLFAVYFIWIGLPAAPIVLPEDEAELCLCYGCKSIDEVLHVLELDDTKLLRSMWGSTDPEVQMKLVLRINGDRMVEKMAERSIGELVSCMRSNVAWRRELPSVGNDMLGIPLNLAMLGSNFSRLIDNSKLGQGQAKTMEQFQSEVASGRSKFVVDEKDSSKMKRLVSLVALRLFSNHGSNKKVLFQMSEQFPDGRSRFKPQLPGTKKGSKDTLQSCIISILKKYNMTQLKINVLDETVHVSETTGESPSYPGVVTVYKKELVDAYIVEDSYPALAAIGLPDGNAWSMCNNTSKYVYTLEWLTEDEFSEKNVMGSQAGTSSIGQAQYYSECSESSRGVAQPNEENGQTAEDSKIKSANEIIRSFAARDFSKKLVFMLHMDDVDGLEYWLMNETACNICEAFIDLDTWVEADPKALMEKFCDLLPNERIASLLQKRHDLKAVAIHLLKQELVQVQKKNAQMSTDLV